MKQIVVVGANLAGLRAAETLRSESFDGSIIVLNGERQLPYDRPPLSKQVLTGGIPPEQTIYRDQPHYEDLGIELRSGHRATGLDLDSQTVEVAGEALHFDGLIIATGASARTLAHREGLEGVFVMRTMDDARAVRAAFKSTPRVVVIGAGFIGSEVAASARAAGLKVTVVEALPTPLSRALGAEMGRACATLHYHNGTDLRCGVGVEAIEGDRHVERVRLSDGSVVDADLVIVGVGVVPAVGWLAGTGLTIGNGLVCDETLNTGHPAVYAAGDLVWWPNSLFGIEMRCEHWTNAAEQGCHAARNLLAGRAAARPYAGSCYFWSDQYGVRIQFVGVAAPDEVTIVRGSVDEHKFVAFYRAGNRIVGALGMNSAKLVMKAKMMIEQRVAWDDALSVVAGL